MFYTFKRGNLHKINNEAYKKTILWILTFRQVVQGGSDVVNENNAYQEKRKQIINYIFEYRGGKNCQGLAEYLKR